MHRAIKSGQRTARRPGQQCLITRDVVRAYWEGMPPVAPEPTACGSARMGMLPLLRSCGPAGAQQPDRKVEDQRQGGAQWSCESQSGNPLWRRYRDPTI